MKEECWNHKQAQRRLVPFLLRRFQKRKNFRIIPTNQKNGDKQEMNKVIIGILVLLLVVNGALGYYSFDLNKQFSTLSDELSNELTTFREETATQISTLSDELSDELTTFREETATQIGTLSDELSDELTTFNGETATQSGTIRDELKDVVSKIAQSELNNRKLDEEVKREIVEV